MNTQELKSEDIRKKQFERKRQQNIHNCKK